MTFRSRLFATVAFPVLAGSLIATPSLADALTKPYEIAQESGEGQQPTEEELLLQQQQQQQQDEEAQRAAEEQQRQAEEQQRAAEEEQRAAEEQQRAADEEQQRQAEEQKAAEEQQRAADEEQQRAAEEQKAAEEQQRAAEEEQQRAADEQKAAEEQQRAADEQKAAEEQQKAAEEEQQRAADEQEAAEEQKAAEEQQQQQQSQDQQAEQPAEQQAEQPAEQQPDAGTAETTTEPPTGEQPAVAGEQQPADTGTGEQPAVAGEEQPVEPGTEQPATAETGEQPAAEPVPEVVDTRTEEENKQIAEDPGQTDDTVVLPVENGAAVLDSDKDADRTGGQTSREERRKQREEQRAQEEIPVPESDDNAQAQISEEVRQAVPQRVKAAIEEKGERTREAPAFAAPETTNIIVNNTVINNTTINNNGTEGRRRDRDGGRVTVLDRDDDRMVLQIGNQLYVRGDDRPRLRRDSEEVYYDNLARGRTRETIVRPGGVEIVTIYNRYGDIIQRSRVGADGREYILVYAPELEDDEPRPGLVDVGYDLPPMRLRIPVSDYIIDTSSNPDRDYYDFLAEPPVERVYTIDEVKQSARLRDKVRRIDLDTITFATGSAEIPMSQARTMRSVAEAMQKVLDKDPGETFLIEGHTDAVGSDRSNLVLSDERAGSVASLLTEVYGIPPENLQTQGYGERFLKVKTQSAEQQNRRVTIRRVTTLVRPVARAN